MPVPWCLETQLFLQPELRQQRQGGGAEGIAGLRREPLKAERSPKSVSFTAKRCFLDHEDLGSNQEKMGSNQEKR